MYWTKENIEELKLGYSIGLKRHIIASILNTSISSIARKAAELNLIHDSFNNNTEWYIKELKVKNPGFICLDNYINSITKIRHQCGTCHKITLDTPNYKLQGNGCNLCAHKNNRGGLIATKPGVVYLVYIDKYDLYKIGITNKSTKERMQDNRIKNYNIILERHFDTGTECEMLEKEWLSNIRDYKINTGLLKTGNTETFRY